MDRERLDVVRIGAGRLRIRGAPPGAASVAELRDWLASRGEVVSVEYRERTGAVDVRYREERGTQGAFARTLEDRIHTLERVEPVGRSVQIAHALPGRVRLRVLGVPGDDVLRIAAWLAGREGVARATASPASQAVLVLYDPRATSDAALAEAVRLSDPADWPDTPPPPRSPWTKPALASVVLAATASGALPPAAAAASVALTALPPVRRAFAALRRRELTVDLLDVAAIGISVGTGQPATAAFITWLLSVGDLVLDSTADRARRAISNLMQLDASEAWRVVGDRVERVAARRLSPGDRIAVEAGERVAADGVVASGEAMVDEKALTGESMPSERRAGDRVLAASVVVEGRVVVLVERAGVDTTAAKIVRILEGAGAKPMTLQREVQRVADRVVLPTFGVAGGAALLAGQLDRMTSVLITDFGTGLRIAVPTSALAWMTAAARQGVLIKGSQYLERLAKSDVVVFDKTGTLTGGAPEIVAVEPIGDASPAEVVALAAAAEARQGHPLAEAVRRRAARDGVAVPCAELGSEEARVGLGVAARVAGTPVLVGGERWMRANGVDERPARALVEELRRGGASAILVAADHRVRGVLGWTDAARDEAAEVVAALRAGGRREVVLLSGDAKAAVASIAARVGVDHAEGELLPEQKAEVVRARQREGRVVAMIGDGINDAPALAVADVGISLSGGTDVALETADVVLLEGGLAKLPLAFDVAASAMRDVRRGLGLVIAPNAVAIALGAFGLLGPAAAAAVNNGSTVVAALAAAAPLFRTRRGAR